MPHNKPTMEGPAPSQPPPCPSRRRPAHGVLIRPFQPTIVFVTVCTADHRPWLATAEVHLLLREVWEEASAWLVGRYVIMPSHLHLFAGLGELELPLDNWVRYWKSQFTRRHGRPEHRWQAGHWDTRLRRSESYDGKWEYVRGNPVRHRLVAHEDDWEFQGELHELAWW